MVCCECIVSPDYDESDSFERLIIVIIAISAASLLIIATLICVGIVIILYMRYRSNKTDRNIEEHIDHSCESVKETLTKELVQLKKDFTKTSDENAKQTQRIINEIYHYKYLLESIKTLMEVKSQSNKTPAPNVNNVANVAPGTVGDDGANNATVANVHELHSTPLATAECVPPTPSADDDEDEGKALL